MKKIILSISSILLSVSFVNAQDTAKPKPIIPTVKLGENVTVKFGGFVRAEYYVDSRTPVGAVDNLFGFFPAAESKDAGGKDLNEIVRQNFSTQSTRFNGLFNGPDVGSAKSSAFFEFDFSGGAGTNGVTTNPIGLRLRHAWTKLSWTKADLVIGKTWNPLSDITFPSVIGLHTGIPFRPFGRGDQLRLVLKPTSSINILLAGVYQSEHKTFNYNDASGLTIANTNDITFNSTPDFHLQIQYKTSSVFAGLVSEYKIVRPATQTTGTKGKFLTKETVSSYAFGGFIDYKKSKFNIKVSGLYGQNLSELFQQGGYALKSFDATTGAKTYTVSNGLTGWINLTYGEKWIVGLFGGYSKNLGFNDNILTPTQANGQATFLGRWQNVDHIYRVAPSLKYNIGRLVLAAEVDYNIAGYGTIDFNNKGKIKDIKDISGTRGLLAATFLF